MSRESYDQQLRVIGQALEARRIQVFDLTRQGEQYVVKGAPETEASLLGRLRDWRQRLGGGTLDTTLSYARHDIQRLERIGESQRSKPHRLPDFYNLSNTLRTIGSYLDAKGAELLELHKRQLSVTILYRTREGHPNLEERAIASFYNLFVSLHGKRRK